MSSEPNPVAAPGQRPEGDLLQGLGAQFVIRLSALIRTARMHDVTNQAFQKQLLDFMALLARAMETESEVVIVAAADYFYLNGVRIKAESSLMSIYHSLMGEFERRQVGGMRIREGVNAAEMERYFQLFMAAEDPTLAERFAEIVEAAMIENIVPLPPITVDPQDVARHLDEKRQPTSERGRAKKVFWRAVLGTKRILLRATQTGRPDLRHAKRLVQPVVDGIMGHEYSIVGLTALKDHDEYTYAHCVNVSILSVSMGHVLGLSRQALADLGVAALLHDIGKITIPGDVLRKPAKLTAEEWDLMRRHPLEGMKMMVRMPGLSMLSLDAMRVCLEHHVNVDRTGYPEVGEEWTQSTMARIVALADCFDAMTAHRAYHRRAYTSFEGLHHLLGPSRVQFDPAVLYALVRTVGLYPPGTVMLTNSGHVVLSLSPNPADLRRPHCRVLVRPDGSLEPEDGATLWDPMPGDIQVVRVLRPEEQQVNTQELLAA